MHVFYMNYIVFLYLTLPYIEEYLYVALQSVTLRYVTLRYVTLRYATLRYVTIHYITYIHASRRADTTHTI